MVKKIMEILKTIIKALGNPEEAAKEAAQKAKPKSKGQKVGKVDHPETKEEANQEVKPKKVFPGRIKFKKKNKERLKKEFKRLKKENRPLYDLLKDLRKFISKEIGKDLVITMIFRTQEEQDYLYRNDPEYREDPWTSPHQYWHSLDKRSWIYTEAERQKIVEYLNKKYNASNYYGWTSKVHEVGNNGKHFHTQYYKA